MDELDQILKTLTEGLRTLAAQFATVWVPIQLGLIVLAALVGWAIAKLVRRRVDLGALTMDWPIHLRLALRAFVGAAAIVPAALVCAAAVAAEVLVATEALGPAYESLDLTAVERAE